MAGNGRSILIVDDLRVFLELERTCFERAGFEVMTAESGEEALEKTRAFQPDAVLLDLYMPDLDGAEVCRRIKRDPILRGTGVVIITSKLFEKDRLRCVVAGCDGFISKISPHTEILLEIERVLSKAMRVPGVASLSLNVSYGLPEQRMRPTLGFDLGPDGLFVASEQSPPRGVAVHLQLELAGFEQSLRLEGEVIRSRNTGDRVPGFHVRFVDPEASALRMISDYLRVRVSTGARCSID